ncbi:MAG TPA: arsenate reductase ArsC [Nitrospiraceae bacterium]|nr:arsenate reductase ArsC [Nitrospiraceae bacterium]
MSKPRVLFLCTGNSARSQMAEGWLRHLAGDRYEAASAGTEPVGLNPLAAEAMKEAGVDIASHRSKRLDEYVGQQFDHVITVCDRAKQTCPLFHGALHTHHWSFEDPAAAQGTHAKRLDAFRTIRDQIRLHVVAFLKA